ncbi:transposase [Rhodococcus opacus]|uniref:transposase n=1 Tax=Rhodococcus opacus TaxID=37919 RepID=UPI0020164875|nr:transposase [Rhodococcus opacus]MDV7090752.1 transposase [Rhodococcus opacus]WKN61374.1 transposase [Rhodococcus opacus]
MPGVGPTLAAVFVAEIGDAHRFADSAHLCSWAGLTPSTENPIRSCTAVTSPSRAPNWCGGRRSRPSNDIRRRRRSPPTKIASKPVAARTSPRSPRPASCSRSSTTDSATDISVPWPGIGRREHPGRSTCVAAVCHDPRTAWSPA